MNMRAVLPIFGAGMVALSITLAPVSPSAEAAESNNGLSSLAVGETLEDFFTAAIDFSPQLRIAEEGLNIGRAREKQAQGQLQPQVNANANLTDNTRNSFSQFGQPITEQFDGERFSVSLQQVLFNWQAFAARRRATQIENQLEAEYYFELSLLLTDVAERYLNVLLAQDALTSIGAEVEAVTNQLNQIQSLFNLQLAQITDLRQAEASLIATQAEQLRLEAQLAIAQENLRAITGIDVGTLYVLNEGTEIPEAQSNMQYWVEMAERNNQQIRARRYALEAAEESISESKGAYMPRVNFFATRQESNVGFDNRFLGDTDTTYIGVDVTIPIYAGGANRARESEARAQRNIAENELRQTELDANASVRSAFLQQQSSRLLAEAAERLVESTRLSSEAAQQGFELGTVTNVDVLNALRDQFQAERDLQRARYEQINYLLLLKREAGTLNASDLVEVSRLMIAPDA
jgi:outer membrane protein